MIYKEHNESYTGIKNLKSLTGILFVIEMGIMILVHMLPGFSELARANVAYSLLIVTFIILGYLYFEKHAESKNMFNLYKNLFDTTTDILLFVKSDGSIIEVNDAASKIYGYPREELLTLNIRDLRDPEANQYTVEQLKKNINEGIILETRHKTKDGRIFPVEANSKSTVLNGQRASISIIRNISARKDTENELLYVKQQLESFLENAVDAIQITDTNGLISYVNNAYEHLFAWPRHEVLGKFFPLVPEKLIPEAYEILKQVLNDKSYIALDTIRNKKDGTNIPVDINYTPVKDLSGRVTAIACTIRDITERKKAEENISFMAYHDYLTGLPNRRQLDEYLTKVIEEYAYYQPQEENLAVAFLDIDGFKNANNLLGHIGGDNLLKDISQKLACQIGEGEMIGRFRGTQFLIIKLLKNSPVEIQKFTDKILQVFAKSWTAENYVFHLTCSMGIAFYPQNGNNTLSLMKNADTAMFSAKNLGKNHCLVYTEEMGAQILKKIALENSLRGALENNEFEVYYQPKVDARNRDVVGLEALLRWENKELGMISPVEFIPIAEETGLIIPIGKWVIEQVCRQINIWNKKGFNDVPISVNISPVQFQDCKLIDYLKNAIKKFHINPRLFEIEITENILIQDVSYTYETLQSIKELHISIAIDDFGTGYSSLSYLQKFPIDILKIDRCFVKDITSENEDATIIKAIIALAKSLNMDVLAEGMETEEQADMLKKMGCYIMQGFLYYKPMPVNELEAGVLSLNKTCSIGAF